MKAEIIKAFNDAYERDDLEKCETKLFFLMLMYNTDIREGEPYEHDLKHSLFKANCIRNPIGIKYTPKDYEKAKQIVGYVLNLVNAINTQKVDTQDIFQEGLTIDDKIMRDILDVAVYTECFYKMNSVNSARMHECEDGKIPFVEQLIENTKSPAMLGKIV